MARMTGECALYTAEDVHGGCAAELETEALDRAARFFRAPVSHLEVAETYKTEQRDGLSYATILVRLARAR